MKYAFMKPYGFHAHALNQNAASSLHTLISLSLIVARDNLHILMLSTDLKKSDQSFVIICNLLALLKERGKTQKQLATATGLLPERINRLAHQGIVSQIVTHTAIKVCLVLSNWPRLRDRKKVRIRLDALFPIKRQFDRKKRQ